MTQEEKIKNSFLYMNAGEPLADFLKECEISIVRKDQHALASVFSTYFFTFKVPAQTFKKFESRHLFFQGKLKEGLHNYHQYDSVIVNLTADWDKLEAVSAEVRPVTTPWQEINSMQETLVSQVHTASSPISFQNVGNTARHLLRKLAELVFDAARHTPPDNKFDLGPENYKNRLWAFVLYKIPPSSSADKVREYAKVLLEASDKAIDLSQSVTHAINADAFVARTCAISALTTVQFIKLVYDRPDPS